MVITTSLKELYEQAVTRHMENSPVCVINEYGEERPIVGITMENTNTLINGKNDRYVMLWINDEE